MTDKRRMVTSESVLAAAVAITEAQGLPNLSILGLAAALGIKPASLYNHIKGIGEVKASVARYAIGELNVITRDAAIGYAHDEALLRIAYALRDFAATHPELYSAINLFEVLSADEHKEMLRQHLNVVHQILDTYRVDDDARMHFMYAFRSGLHGFVSLEAVGAIGTLRSKKVMDESFRRMTLHLIKMLEASTHGKQKSKR